MEVCVFRHSDKSKIYHLKRFNDQYHNEACDWKNRCGWKKKWADRLALSFNYSYFYKEIQTGVYQDVVFGEKIPQRTFIGPFCWNTTKRTYS